ncbi:MAG: SCO family protein [Magnetococcales bacterium]|nr:SCO family protein [Magnetococcales bacterium]
MASYLTTTAHPNHPSSLHSLQRSGRLFGLTTLFVVWAVFIWLLPPDDAWAGIEQAPGSTNTVPGEKTVFPPLFQPAAPDFDAKEAFRLSREVIGSKVSNHIFKDRKGRKRALASFRGKPLIISLVYSSCYHVCSVTSRYLDEVVQNAREALGEETFSVVTIGFDTRVDTPAAMTTFARQQQISDPRWHFLSTDAETIKNLTRELGFSYIRSPRGFDHIVQATVVDQEGIIFRQVYGEIFDVPSLVEPLKGLILGRPVSEDEPILDDMIRRFRFFCTVYDPTLDAYKFEYSFFVGMFIGGTIILITGIWLFREVRRANYFRKS